jgi:hypothetical protein
MANVTITREVKTVQPYPRNGNVGTQAPSYEWVVRVDGKFVCRPLSTLRQAKSIAAEFGSATIVR